MCRLDIAVPKLDKTERSFNYKKNPNDEMFEAISHVV